MQPFDDKRTVRAAHNEGLFRAVNEKIRTLNETWAEFTGTWAVLCECSDLSCAEMVELRPAAYAEVRRHRGRFIVLPDHCPVDRVVEEHAGYLVVENAAAVAEAASAPGEPDDA